MRCRLLAEVAFVALLFLPAASATMLLITSGNQSSYGGLILPGQIDGAECSLPGGPGTLLNFAMYPTGDCEIKNYPGGSTVRDYHATLQVLGPPGSVLTLVALDHPVFGDPTFLSVDVAAGEEGSLQVHQRDSSRDIFVVGTQVEGAAAYVLHVASS